MVLTADIFQRVGRLHHLSSLFKLSSSNPSSHAQMQAEMSGAYYDGCDEDDHHLYAPPGGDSGGQYIDKPYINTWCSRKKALFSSYVTPVVNYMYISMNVFLKP